MEELQLRWLQQFISPARVYDLKNQFLETEAKPEYFTTPRDLGSVRISSALLSSVTSDRLCFGLKQCSTFLQIFESGQRHQHLEKKKIHIILLLNMPLLYLLSFSSINQIGNSSHYDCRVLIRLATKTLNSIPTIIYLVDDCLHLSL